METKLQEPVIKPTNKTIILKNSHSVHFIKKRQKVNDAKSKLTNKEREEKTKHRIHNKKMSLHMGSVNFEKRCNNIKLYIQNEKMIKMESQRIKQPWLRAFTERCIIYKWIMAKLAIPTIKVPLLQIIIRYTKRRNKFGNSSEIGNFYRTPAKSILQQNYRSEKTAIASVAYKQDFVWIACYGKSSYLSSRYHILHERRICPFPDSKKLRHIASLWYEVQSRKLLRQYPKPIGA